MKEEKKKKAKTKLEAPAERSSSDGRLIAKKDFAIHHNGYTRHIKAGEDVSDVPAHYHANLRTEGVL